MFIDYNDSGTVWTTCAHIITAVIGSGVLSLAWAIAQLGWIAGPAVMFLFSLVTYYTSTLLSACYRTGDPVNGKRHCTYMDAVLCNLGKFCCYFDIKVSVLSKFLILIFTLPLKYISGGAKAKSCGFVQYLVLFGVAVGCTLSSSISMM